MVRLIGYGTVHKAGRTASQRRLSLPWSRFDSLMTTERPRLTHVGDSQAVRSLTQCGEPMRFAMAAPIDLRNDFDSVLTMRRSRVRGPGTRPRAVVCWRCFRGSYPIQVAAGRMRRGSAASVCRSFATACCASTVARGSGRGWSMGSHRAHASKLNADHRRALAEVVEAGPYSHRHRRRRAWRRKPGAVALGDVRHRTSLDETTVGRELKALGFAKISARPQPLRAKRAGRRGF